MYNILLSLADGFAMQNRLTDLTRINYVSILSNHRSDRDDR